MGQLRFLASTALTVTIAFAAGAVLAQTPAAAPDPETPAPDTLAPPEQMPRTAPIAPGFGAEAKDQAKEGPRVAQTDQAFLLAAARSGWSELRAANLAATKTQNPKVKQFAYMIVTDHGKTNDELEGLAKSRMLALGSPDPARVRQVESLQKQSGGAYDRAFLDLMVSDHRQAIALYEKAAAASTDPQVKDYATRTLDPLRKHLSAAEEVRATLGKDRPVSS